MHVQSSTYYLPIVGDFFTCQFGSVQQTKRCTWSSRKWRIRRKIQLIQIFPQNHTCRTQQFRHFAFIKKVGFYKVLLTSIHQIYRWDQDIAPCSAHTTSAQKLSRRFNAATATGRLSFCHLGRLSQTGCMTWKLGRTSFNKRYSCVKSGTQTFNNWVSILSVSFVDKTPSDSSWCATTPKPFRPNVHFCVTASSLSQVFFQDKNIGRAKLKPGRGIVEKLSILPFSQHTEHNQLNLN